ncbi:MAG: hypothetical protein OXH94_07155 [Rhodospirillales bacterium]|nr:hypothetical protein [Rhodospirillales bacterium]
MRKPSGAILEDHDGNADTNAVMEIVCGHGRPAHGIILCGTIRR